MRELECPECGEIFSKKDVIRNLKKYGFMECQSCFAKLKVDDFREFYPMIDNEVDEDG